MLLHLCRCGKPIPQGVPMCDTCKARHGSRHMIYNRQQRSAEAAAFYCTRAWRTIRPVIIDLFDGIDIVAFYESDQLLDADRVHHIVELEEAWELRLHPMNLFPLANATHTRITAEYKRSRENMEACQRRLIEYRERYFADRGGVEKVFRDAGLVAPIFSVEKTPHQNFRT